ncbi:MAG: phospholipid carrier-dependent glycosyltransferase [Planctomycetaceae bacterium]
MRCDHLAAVTLLVIHAGLLAWSATKHSPTAQEPQSLVAGLSHWELGDFQLFRVNPPLVRMVAALPVIAAGYESDWSKLKPGIGDRPGFDVGNDFAAANGERTFWLITIARWACIPFSLAGGVSCFLWAKELTGRPTGGLIALFLWSFDPNILAHGEFIMTDCAAAAFGVAAGYGFWRWLRRPNWQRAVVAGILLGLAQLTKTSWILLYALWPAVWLCWSRFGRHRELPQSDGAFPGFRIQSGQLAVILLISVYLLNLIYGFDGTLTPLREFHFVSRALNGADQTGQVGNRFRDSVLGHIPVPLPLPYVEGIDIQKSDFEKPWRSFLRGEWKPGGWWYYYLYGFCVKTPHGTQLLFVIAVLTTLVGLCRRKSAARSHAAVPASDLAVVLLPPIALIALVSSQLAMNLHFRYVLPSTGFLFVFIAATFVGLLPKRIEAEPPGRC